MSSHILDTLKARGFIAQMSHEEETYEHLSNPGKTFYIGFDPTADSLHIGHLFQMVVMRHFQNAGHRPIALLGGGTGMVGDPSGRTDLRQVLTPEAIEHNVSRFREQMSLLLDFSPGKAIVDNNARWLLELNYVSFNDAHSSGWLRCGQSEFDADIAPPSAEAGQEKVGGGSGDDE